MSRIVVRRPTFAVDEDVPFQWQPANPVFSVFGNAFTFVAPAFERYIVAATRQAMPRITDPAVAEEAEAFLRQEAQHAKAHRGHAKALIAQHPGLEETMATANEAYDRLLAERDLEFHLAYIAALEATFTPLFKMVFDNRAALFAGSDERVGSLLIWHFAEEIEHRSSALVIHRHITPDRWYRPRHARQVFRHVGGVFERILHGFEEHVPPGVLGIPMDMLLSREMHLGEVRARIPWLRSRRPAPVPTMLADVSGRDLLAMLWHLAGSQLPGHDPEHEPLPAYADTWFAAYDRGEDITTYAGAHL